MYSVKFTPRSPSSRHSRDLTGPRSSSGLPPPSRWEAEPASRRPGAQPTGPSGREKPAQEPSPSCTSPPPPTLTSLLRVPSEPPLPHRVLISLGQTFPTSQNPENAGIPGSLQPCQSRSHSWDGACLLWPPRPFMCMRLPPLYWKLPSGRLNVFGLLCCSQSL